MAVWMATSRTVVMRMQMQMQIVPCRQAAVGQFASPMQRRDLSRRSGRRQWERVCGYSLVFPITNTLSE